VRKRRRQVHFVSHEIAEYAVAAAIVAIGADTSGGLSREFLVAGCLLGALNVFTKGRFGVFKVLGRHLHHAGDVVIAVYLAAAPFFGFVERDVLAILCAEALAFLLVLIEQSTRYVDPKTQPGVLIETSLVKAPNSHASQNALLEGVGPVVNRVVHTSARHLGVLTGVSRRTIRARKAQRSE
jgi:hypothetical protein